jgi:hypothetical protein
VPLLLWFVLSSLIAIAVWALKGRLFSKNTPKIKLEETSIQTDAQIETEKHKKYEKAGKHDFSKSPQFLND